MKFLFGIILVVFLLSCGRSFKKGEEESVAPVVTKKPIEPIEDPIAPVEDVFFSKTLTRKGEIEFNQKFFDDFKNDLSEFVFEKIVITEDIVFGDRNIVLNADLIVFSKPTVFSSFAKDSKAGENTDGRSSGKIQIRARKIKGQLKISSIGESAGDRTDFPGPILTRPKRGPDIAGKRMVCRGGVIDGCRPSPGEICP